MDLSERRSNPAFPTNRLAARGIIRDVAELILNGEDIHRASAKEFIDSYQNYLNDNGIGYDETKLTLTKTTFKRWVKGKSFPQKKYLINFFNPLFEIRNRWELRKVFTCRFQRLLASLDLKWMSLEQRQKKEADDEAENILKEIHIDWQLDKYLNIAIKGNSNENIGNPFLSFFPEAEEYEKKYSRGMFGLKLNYRSYIYPEIDFQDKVLYQMDNRTSIIPHLFWLAAHLQPDGTKVHVSLIFDLITAVIVTTHLNYYRIGYDPFVFGGSVSMQEYVGDFCWRFFLSDFHELTDSEHGPNRFGSRSDLNSLEFEFKDIFQPNFESNSGLCFKDDAFINLVNLKNIFFETISKKTGLDSHEVLNELKGTQAYVDMGPNILKPGGAQFLDV